MESEVEYSEVLFLMEDGMPLEFYIPPGKERKKLKSLIEKGGGLVASYRQTGNSIRLFPPSVALPPGGLSTQYIYDCVTANQLLPRQSYIGKEQRKSDKKSMVESMTEGRHPFTPDEDKAILDYVQTFAGGINGKVTGVTLWKEMERRKLTSHTWQSMKDRYLRRLNAKGKNSNKVYPKVAEVTKTKDSNKNADEKRSEESSKDAEEKRDADGNDFESTFDEELAKSGIQDENASEVGIASEASETPSSPPKMKSATSLNWHDRLRSSPPKGSPGSQLPSQPSPLIRKGPRPTSVSPKKRNSASVHPTSSLLKIKHVLSPRKTKASPAATSLAKRITAVSSPAKRKKISTASLSVETKDIPATVSSATAVGQSSPPSIGDNAPSQEDPRASVMARRRSIQSSRGGRTKLDRLLQAFSGSRVRDALICMSGNVDDAEHYLEHGCSILGTPPWTAQEDGVLLSGDETSRKALYRGRRELDIRRRIKFLGSTIPY